MSILPWILKKLILVRVYTNRNYLPQGPSEKCVRRIQDSSLIKPHWLIDALESLDLEFERSVLSEREAWLNQYFFAKKENKDILLLN
ncbi:hypothetical protein FHEFKHOI_01475 [Candidatus Methanoperedenaceae archaeon GB50]|nr:MAG: hypothetical protein KBONHNOK_00234 [Candidatus Methanoperedenaceae archaeon GB50]CAD7773929.1 hypothetical protein FHEFKHOI_01475 [Candidatus Methanoperedenaceae archaeon GB50]